MSGKSIFMNDSLSIHLFQLYVNYRYFSKKIKNLLYTFEHEYFFSDVYKIIDVIEEIDLIKNNLDNKLKQRFECRILF